MITDDDGQYFITSLPPGVYTLTVYYNDTTFSRGNVLIQVGKEAVVNVTVDSRRRDRQAEGRGHRDQGHGPDRRSGLDEDRRHDHRRLHAQHPDRPHVRRRRSGRPPARRATSTASRSPARRRPRTCTSSRASTRRTPASAGCRRTCRTSSSRRPRSSPAATTPSSAARRAASSTSSPSRARTSSTARCSATSRRARSSPTRRSIQREGGSIDSKTEPRLPLRHRRRGRRSDHQGQALVPRRLQPVALARARTTRLVQTPGRRRTATASPTSIRTPASPVHEDVVAARHPARRSQTYFFTGEDQRRDQPEQPVPDLGVRQPAQRRRAGLRLADPQPGADAIIDVRRRRVRRRGKWTSKFNEGKTQIDAVVGYHRGFDEPAAGERRRRTVPYVCYNYTRSLYDFARSRGRRPHRSAAATTTDPNDPYPMIRNCPVFGYPSRASASSRSAPTTARRRSSR